MKLKKMLTLALAVLCFVMAAFPVAAVGDSFSHTTTYNGDPVIYAGTLYGITVTGSLTRDIPDVAPADNYSTGIRLIGKNLTGQLVWADEKKEAHPYCVFSSDGGAKRILPKATCLFYIDPPMASSIHLSSLTANYSDDLAQ